MSWNINSIKIVKGFLTKESCERLINQHHAGEVFELDIPQEKKYSYSNPLDNDFLKGIETLLAFELEDYIRENHINDFPNFKAGDFKIIQYSTGDWFTTHYDGDFSKYPEGGYKYHPITTNIALNNWQDYEGGELHICGKSMKMQAGDLIIMPSSFSFPHGVKMVNKGNRYVLISEPYSLDWGLQDGVVNDEQESKCEKVNKQRKNLFSRYLGFFGRD